MTVPFFADDVHAKRGVVDWFAAYHLNHQGPSVGEARLQQYVVCHNPVEGRLLGTHLQLWILHRGERG